MHYSKLLEIRSRTHKVNTASSRACLSDSCCKNMFRDRSHKEVKPNMNLCHINTELIDTDYTNTSQDLGSVGYNDKDQFYRKVV